MMKFSSIVLRNSAYGMAAQMTIKVLSFIFSVAVIRNLGAESFGQYTAVIAFGAIFMILSDLGLSPYMVREIARFRDEPDGRQRAEKLFSNVVYLRLGLSVVTALITIFAAWLTGRPLVMIGAIALSSFGLFLYAAQASADALLAGYERFGAASAAKVVNQVTFVLLGGLALYMGFGYYGLIAASLVGISLMTIVTWRRARRLDIGLVGVDLRGWPRLLRASLPFALIGFALGLSYKFDTVLLNIFRSDAETGYYNAAYNLVLSAVVISNVVNTALYPSLTRRSEQTPAEMPALYERVLRYLLILALPIAFGGWALADSLIQFLYSADYQPAALAFKVLVWVLPFMFASEFLGYIILIRNQERRVGRSILVSTTFNVLFNLLLVPRFGFRAAAFMTVVTEAILVLQHLWTLRDLVPRFNWAAVLLRPLAAAALMAAVVLATRPYLSIFMSIGLGAAAYAVVGFALGLFGKDEQRFLRSLFPKKELAPTE